MHTEFRILEVRRGHVWAQPLDAVKQESLRIAGASKYIENEIIVAEPLSGAPGVPTRWKVIASRIDPSFVGGQVPKLVPIDEENEENEYQFTEYVRYEEGDDFEDALEILRSGNYETAAHLLRAFIRRSPYHIDSYHHLGIIETDLGHRRGALKYFEMGVAMGSKQEAAQYLQETGGWMRKESRDFLRRLMAAKPFVRRLERALELKAALDSHDSLRPGEVRSAKVDELFAIFDEAHIPKILEECRDAL